MGRPSWTTRRMMNLSMKIPASRGHTNPVIMEIWMIPVRKRMMMMRRLPVRCGQELTFNHAPRLT